MAREPNLQGQVATDHETERRLPSLGYSVFSLLLIIVILVVGLLGFGASIQMMMFTCMIIAIPLAMWIGHSYEEVEGFAFDSIRKVLRLVIILLAVGTLVGAWILSGTVPTIVSAGLAIISPQFFLLAAVVLCIFTALATGTSWGTVGTVGIAMMGIGAGLGIPAGVTAGAVICGALFGDKMSPLSDSTNLAPAVSGAELIPHIKRMMWTTIPAIVITMIIFTVIGLVSYGQGTVDTGQAETIASALNDTFKLGLVPLIPVVVTLTLLSLQKPAFPSIFTGAVIGALVAVLYQGASVGETLSVMYEGYEANSGVEIVDTLLSAGGLTSFLALGALFIFAVGLGGILSGSGMLESILQPFMSKITSERRLVVSTIPLTYITLFIGSAFSFAAVITATLMSPLYQKFGLDRENLSRILEDVGTVNDPVVPWGPAAAFMAAALGVSPFVYIPFLFFSFLCPIFSLIYGLTGFTIKKVPHEPEPEPEGSLEKAEVTG